MSLTYTDIFCGAGGSSIGLSGAGMELKLAANHWARAIETHSSNFVDADHLCADVSNYDMRRLPRTDVLWASPICTENSPAGGNAGINRRHQLDLLEEGPIEQGGFQRTRATFHDVIRASEVHRYKAVLVENVVEAATRWELFDWWVEGMIKLGYNVQFVSVSSAHIGSEDNPYAPQWRDRLYLVFTRRGIPLPDVDPRPISWCPRCDVTGPAVQSWKKPGVRRIGKYGQQYVYRCRGDRCHQIVEPFVLPAAAAIDWSDLGTRIGDRARPLAAATIRRIKAGLQMFAQPVPPLSVTVNHGGGDSRAYPLESRPLPSRTARIGDGMVVTPLMVYGYSSEPEGRVKPVADPLDTIAADGRGHDGLPVAPAFLTMQRAHNRAIGIYEPLATVATGRHHGLTVPAGAFIQKHHGGLEYARIEHMTKSVNEPLPGVVARPNLSLVIPYRRGNAKTTAEPFLTMGTGDSAALVHVTDTEVDDCRFRMLQPREHLRAQRFPDSYIVTGNKGEQTMQAGNAVSANVPYWLGQALTAALGGVA